MLEVHPPDSVCLPVCIVVRIEGQLAKNRVSDNVGGVKFISSTLRRALMEERHFALVDGFRFANRRLAS